MRGLFRGVDAPTSVGLVREEGRPFGSAQATGRLRCGLALETPLGRTEACLSLLV